MTDKEKNTKDFLEGYEVGKQALESRADEPVNTARREQNQRIANQGLNPTQSQQIITDSNEDPVKAARDAQNQRIANQGLN